MAGRLEFLPEFEREKTPKSLFSVAGLPIEIAATSSEQIAYFCRVAYPFVLQLKEATEPKVVFSLHTQDVENLSEFLGRQRIIAQDANGLFFGKIDSDVYFRASKVSKYIDFYWYDGEKHYHACVGKYPEYSLTSFIKIHLIREYSSWIDLCVFHASSSFYIPNHTGVVFSTPDKGGQLEKFGKTTSVLSCITDPEMNFAFCSNDEVVVGLEDEQLHYFAFPNEIPIRRTNLINVFENRRLPCLEAWTGKDVVTGDEILITTTAGLKTAGCEIGKLENIGHWIFVDLTFGACGNKISSLSTKDAHFLFRDSVFNNRMRQLTSHIALGEQNHLLPSKLPEVDTDRVFAKLMRNDVKFWLLTGGTLNPTSLRTVIKKVI